MAAVSSAATAAAARIGAALSDAQYFESSMVRVEDIRRQLDSSSIKEKLDAMKRVIALISLGKDASTFFPDVVKNVAAASLEVKKLVYLYLVHYAEEKQDLALLAVNSFQRDLSDHNQHIRALSLRVLSSIRVKVILQVVIHAINNASKDSSSYVRKAAAHAIGKVCALDAASKELLIQPLQDLLADRSTEVLGSAVAAFDEVSPYQFDLLHPHYRRFCRALGQIDPWGQIFVLHVLMRYARVHFKEPKNVGGRNEDLSLLLENAAPLFMSLNTSVVSATVALFYHLASPEEFREFAIKPLMRLVAVQDVAGQAVALNIAAAVAAKYPATLIPYASELYVSPAHTAPIRLLRMNVLTMLCAGAGKDGGIGSKPNVRRTLLAELKEYLFRSDKALAAASARAFGCLATAHPDSTSAIVKVLSSVVKTATDPGVVTESIGVLRRLLQRHPSTLAKALPLLIGMLLSEDDENLSFKEPAARASVIWLIGEFYEQVQTVATEALRLLARGFVDESAEVKLQILNLAAKIVAWTDVNGEDPVSVAASGHVKLRLLEHVVSCAKFDRDYDVRDKARMLSSLLLTEPKSPLLSSACDAFLSKKPAPTSDKAHDSSVLDYSLDPNVILGSLAHVMSGRRLAGFRPLEAWAERDSDGALRESVYGDAIGTSVEREYRGVSSAEYHGSFPSTTLSSSLWERAGAHLPTSIMNKISGGSSMGNDMGGGTTGIGGGMNGMGGGMTGLGGGMTGIGSGMMGMGGGMPGIGSSSGGMGHMGMPSMLGAPSSSLSVAAKKFANVDPESFYANDDSHDDGADDEDDEDESEYETDTEDEEEEKEDAPTATSKLRVEKSVPKVQHNVGLVVDLLGSSNIPSSAKGATVVAAKKATSEYDLSALLGDMSMSTGAGSEIKSTLKEVVDLGGKAEGQSPWLRIIDNWKAGGLEIDVSYCRSASGSGQDVTPAILRVTNVGKVGVKDVRFSSRSGDCFLSRGLISEIDVGESKEVKVEARFRGKTMGVKFSIDIGGKSVGNGEFKPTAGYVIRPHKTLTPGDFLNMEQSLKGMFSSEASVRMTGPKNSDWMGLSGVMKEELMKCCFLAHVKTAVGGRGVGDDERFSMLFGGYLPAVQVGWDEKRSVLVRIVVKGGNGDGAGCDCGIWVGCEDVLFSANLMQVCKTAMLNIDTSM